MHLEMKLMKHSLLAFNNWADNVSEDMEGARKRLLVVTKHHDAILNGVERLMRA
jgi:hypothetical protein